MTSRFSSLPFKPALPLNNTPAVREPCLFQAERNLPCGAIVREQSGRIIAKTTILTAP